MSQYLSLDVPDLNRDLIALLAEQAGLSGACRLALVGGAVRDLMLYKCCEILGGSCRILTFSWKVHPLISWVICRISTDLTV